MAAAVTLVRWYVGSSVVARRHRGVCPAARANAIDPYPILESGSRGRWASLAAPIVPDSSRGSSRTDPNRRSSARPVVPWGRMLRQSPCARGGAVPFRWTRRRRIWADRPASSGTSTRRPCAGALRATGSGGAAIRRRPGPQAASAPAFGLTSPRYDVGATRQALPAALPTRSARDVGVGSLLPG